MEAERKSVKEKYIDYIMENKYGDDDPKYYDANLAYLQSLTMDELHFLGDFKFD